MLSHLRLFSVSLVVLFSSVSCIGLGVSKTSGYSSDSFTQMDDIWFESTIQGRGPSANFLLMVAYNFEGAPYKAGVKVVDASGLSRELVINSLVLTYADTGELIFSSTEKLEAPFADSPGTAPPRSAEAYYPIKSLVNPKDGRVVILTTTFLIQSEKGTIKRSITNHFKPRVSSNVEFFELIHD